jgi:hypothetical protein
LSACCISSIDSLRRSFVAPAPENYWNRCNLDQITGTGKSNTAAVSEVSAVAQISIGTGAARSVLAAAGAWERQGLVHDPPDGTSAPPALGAAAQAAIDLTGRARGLRNGDRAHVVVAQHVT